MSKIVASVEARFKDLGLDEATVREALGIADDVKIDYTVLSTLAVDELIKVKALVAKLQEDLDQALKNFGSQSSDHEEQPMKVVPQKFSPSGGLLTSQVAPVRYDDEPDDEPDEPPSSKIRTKLSSALSATRTFLIRFIG